MADEDLKELWKEYREAQRIRRRAREAVALQDLQRAGIAYELKNNGFHVIITTGNGKRINFWPTHHKWQVAGEKRVRTSGVAGILRYLGKHHQEQVETAK